MGGSNLDQISHVSCSICDDVYCVDEDLTRRNCVTVPPRAKDWACPHCRTQERRAGLTKAQQIMCMSPMNVCITVLSYKLMLIMCPLVYLCLHTITSQFHVTPKPQTTCGHSYCSESWRAKTILICSSLA